MIINGHSLIKNKEYIRQFICRDLVCFVIGHNPLNYCGGGYIEGALQNFKDTHTDWYIVWIAIFLRNETSQNLTHRDIFMINSYP